ncbi:MAG TPA: M20/M25/M40 family metallo-hydrolase, partial [Candidatus Udaeobacter sp.]|nr:M20/M25/M40 family metallo-hydrolase [Candidatus Udaeobacter sp.]
QALTPANREELEALTLFRDPDADLRVLVLGTDAARGAGLAETLDRLERAGIDPHLLPEALPASAFLPLSAAERANPYRQSRLHDPQVRARAVALAGEADATRLEQTVRDLSTGPGTTRYSSRPENALARQYLLDSLSVLFSAPGDTVIIDPFDAEVDNVPETLFNIVARRPGVRPGSGKYVLGGHYDSTARRTPGWNHATDPAPGADDNGSGVACVLEAARILLQEQYDFDLEFCFFGGEEQGLLGSKAYVADSLLSEVDQVLGAIMLDMVAYNPRAADSLNVITNFNSEWLADLVRQSEATLSSANGLDELDKVVAPTRNYSDHASYWGHDASAVLFIENEDIVAHNPRYHTVTDDLDYLLAVDGPDLMRRATEAVVVTIAQFAIGPPPGPLAFSIPAAGVIFHNEEDDFIEGAIAGQAVQTRTRLINSGPAEGPTTVSTTVFVSGNAVAQSDTSFADWGSGVTRETLTWFQVPEGAAGNQNIGIQTTLQAGVGRQVTLASSAPLAVRAAFESIFVAPNPASSAEAAALWIKRPTVTADLHCRLIDALGNELGTFSHQVLPNVREVTFPIRQMSGSADLPSGIYLLQVDLKTGGGEPLVEDETLTFAITR